MAPSNHCLSLSLALLLVLVGFSTPVAAFGAGNIASIARIEGINWRHGDIEDTLLNILMSRAAGGKRFGKLDVKRVYFGNWLRDYSQAVDVGTVKYVSAEAIRILLWVLGFMSFGYGSKEFEVTTERLGCYRPEEHIDNPKDYADNIDARQYDRRLRGPVDERRELSINPQTGLKNYIATENIGIASSAGLIRNLFGRSIQLGRQYARSQNSADLYEALRLLGTGCHCLEDYSAHSNWTELALIELGERDVFPHVGRSTLINIYGARGPVYPSVTGTFGGVDFLHSVMGEFSDKATQSEIQELEGTMENSQQGDSSLLQDLLNKVPSGLFGGKDEAGKADELQANAAAAQMQNAQISPREPEEWTRMIQNVQNQILPIIEWHDEIMKSITEAIENIPVLPALIEQLQDQLNIFVFSLLAPFVLPIINQVKTELNTGSSEIIQSSKDKQLIVFHDDHSTDPTHSMLSKDHFSNILNEPAGKVASQVLKWVVPQLIACWDDERIDVDRTITRIINGVFHHPAQRDYGDDGAVDGRRLMFGVVEQWWGSKDEQERQVLRQQLSREGVETGRNHKPGVMDSGHGCGKPLAMPTYKTASSSGAIGGLAGGLGAGGVFGQIGDALQGRSQYDAGYVSGSGRGSGGSGGAGKFVESAMGGGALGAVAGIAAGALGGDLLGEAFSGSEKKSYQSQEYGEDGSFTKSFAQTGYEGGGQGQGRYGQAEFTQTTYTDGGQRQSYQRYEQDAYQQEQSHYSGGSSGFAQQITQETRPTYGGGYEQTTETRYERPTGEWSTEVRVEGRETESSARYEDVKHFSGHGSGVYDEDERRHGSGSDSHSDSDSDKSDRRRRRRSGSGGEEEYSSRRTYDESSRYERHEEGGRYGGGGGYDESSRYEQRDEGGYGGGSYERREEETSYEQRDDDEGYGYGRRRDDDQGERYEERYEERDESRGYGYDEDDDGGRNY